MNPWIWLVIGAVVVIALALAVRRGNQQRRSPAASDAGGQPRTRATGMGSTYNKEL